MQDVCEVLDVTTVVVMHPKYIRRYTGTAAVVVCLVTFLVASISDPGVVTEANLGHYLQCPYDGVTNKLKVCATCKLQRPARAKHCGACGA